MANVFLKDIAKEHDLNRSWLTQQVKKWDIKVDKELVEGRWQACISAMDYYNLKLQNFRQDQIKQIAPNLIPLKQVQEELVIDRRNIAHYLKKLEIEKREVHDGVNRKPFYAILLSDYKKLREHRLETADHETRKLIK